MKRNDGRKTLDPRDYESEPLTQEFTLAVSGRYGAPEFEAMDEDGQVSLADALSARDRYVESASIPIDGPDEPSYLVETDSRRTRGKRNASPSIRWKEDLREAQEAHGLNVNGDDDNQNEEEDPLRLPAHILSLGRAYEVPAAEKDFGREVLFQVVQEGFNELLDPLFLQKEDLASAVRSTCDERHRFRKEIDAYVGEKKAFQEKLRSGSDVDPLLAIAQSSYQEERQPWTTQQIHDAERPSEDEDVDGIIGMQTQSRLRADVEDEMARLRAEEPFEDLDDMEERIRESATLEELLDSAGYSVGSPREERAVAAFASHDDAVDATVERDRADDLPEREGEGEALVSSSEIAQDGAADPTIRQNRPDDLAKEATESSPSPSETAQDDGGARDPTLPQNRPAAVSASDPTPPTASSSSSSSSSQDPTTAKANSQETKTKSANKDKDPQPPPTQQRLEYLAMLDEEERTIVQRRGPGRLSLQEVEEIIDMWRDESDRSFLTVGIESWLEWAAI